MSTAKNSHSNSPTPRLAVRTPLCEEGSVADSPPTASAAVPAFVPPEIMLDMCVGSWRSGTPSSPTFIAPISPGRGGWIAYRLIGTRSSSFSVLVIWDMVSVPAEMSAVSCVRLAPVEHGCGSSAVSQIRVSSPTQAHAFSLCSRLDGVPVPLPPVDMRQGGGPLKYDDDYFVESARKDLDHLTTLGLGPPGVFSRLRLWTWPSGRRSDRTRTGPGRHRRRGETTSHPVGHLWITSRFPDYRFVHVDAANDRYNPGGAETRYLPVEDGSVDLIAAFSVFTHMLSDDTKRI